MSNNLGIDRIIGTPTEKEIVEWHQGNKSFPCHYVLSDN